MKLLVVIGFLLVVGCGSTTTQIMDSQVGVLTVKDAVLKWGEPVYQRKTADGGTEMVWRSRMYAVSQHAYVHPRGPTYGAAAGPGSTQGIPHHSIQGRGETLIAVFDKKGVMERWDSRRR
jgi:hypothetical protein